MLVLQKLQRILNYCSDNDCTVVDITEYILKEKEEWFACFIENWELIFSCCIDSIEFQNCEYFDELA